MKGSGCGGWGTAHLAVWIEASNQESQKLERWGRGFQKLSVVTVLPLPFEHYRFTTPVLPLWTLCRQCFTSAVVPLPFYH
jgi:hypothetical protein